MDGTDGKSLGRTGCKVGIVYVQIVLHLIGSFSMPSLSKTIAQVAVCI